jgi:hypothetical protein
MGMLSYMFVAFRPWDDDDDDALTIDSRPNPIKTQFCVLRS